MKSPILSIILPTYKSAPYIGRAIESVRNQTFADWELIIVDDGLDNQARSFIEDFLKKDDRIVLLKNPQNLGIQKSLNLGLKDSRGKYIARIDDDDCWVDSEKIQKQIDFLENNPEFVLVGTNALIVGESGEVFGVYKLPESDLDIRKRILLKNCFLHPSVIFLKEKAMSIGGYPEDYENKHVEDYALWLGLGNVGKFANIGSVAVRITVHSKSLTAQNRILQAKRMKALAQKYKKYYPNFWIGQIILSLRIAGFKIVRFLPFGDSFIYKIQKIYKNI